MKIKIALWATLAVLSFAVTKAFPSESLVINGVTYSFPDVDDQNWGQNVTDWATAVSTGVLQKTGGNFPLTAETTFGNSYGLVSLYFKATSSAPATAGFIRLGSTDTISWRSFDNSGNLTLSVSTSTNQLQFNGVALSTIAFGANVLDNSGSTQTKTGSLQIGGFIYASGAGLSGIGSVNIASSTYISSGAATVNSFFLNPTGVVGGTFGSPGISPSITVSADGRILSIASTTISNSASTGIRVSSVVVGPLGALGVDVASSTTAGLTRALELLGASGLTNSTTAQGAILYQSGSYSIAGATIPAGITIYAIPGSSVVWRLTNTTGTIVTVYGTVQNIFFDLASLPFSGTAIQPKSGSFIKDPKIYGGQGMLLGGTDLIAANIIKIEDSTNIFITGNVDGYIYQNTAIGKIGSRATFLINRSTDVFINMNTKNGTPVDTSSTFFGILDSVNVQVGGTWADCGARYATIESGSRNCKIRTVQGKVTSGSAAQGLIVISAGNAQTSLSTGTAVENCDFTINNNASSAIIFIQSGMNSHTYGVRVSNVSVLGEVANSYNFEVINDTGVFSTINRQNTVNGLGGSFISDGGTQTKSASLGNFFNSVQQ